MVYVPPIYLSMLSHCVFPVDSRYRIWSVSVISRRRSNSVRANLRVSARVVGSLICLVPRIILR